MKKLTLLCLIACLVWGLTAKTTVTVIDASRLKVVWELPDWELSRQSLDDTQSAPNKGVDSGYLWLKADGMTYDSVQGAPLIPYAEVKAAVPPGGGISISTQKVTEEIISLSQRLLPVPEIVKTEQTDRSNYSIKENLYTESPLAAVQPLDRQTYRTLQFVPIRINPFAYDGKNKLTVRKTIEFIITITGDTRYNTRLGTDDLTSLLAGSVLNPVQAKQWLSSTRQNINYADFSLSDWWVKIETDRDGMHKINQSQLNMLPLADIDSATLRMFTTGGEVQSTSIEYQGPVFREIPIWVAGESDGSFNAGDYILFYGRDRDGLEMNSAVGVNLYFNPYSPAVSYWLTFGGSFAADPLRISPIDAVDNWQDVVTSTPATTRTETEVYQRMPIGFDWYMSKMSGTQNASYDHSLNLEDLDPTQEQTLSMHVRQEYLSNGSNVLHKIQLNVNGADLLNTGGTVQEWAWGGIGAGQTPITITHTGSYFQAGNNNLHINVLRSGTDNLLLNYLQVAFQKRLIKRSKPFEVSIPTTLSNHLVRYSFTGANSDLRVFKTTATTFMHDTREVPVNVDGAGFYFVSSGDVNARYQVVSSSEYLTPVSISRVEPNDLCHEMQQYDNVIITPPEFQTQANELAAIYLQNWSKKSKVVLLDDIFTQFGGGMPDPNAIRMYLSYAVQNYPSPALTSATLLGSGTLDWRNYSAQAANKNHMICYQKIASTSDDYFVMFNTPQYPELAIGRYPAKTTNEMNIMVNNLRQYLDDPQPGMWRNTLLFMADDEFNGGQGGEYYHSNQVQETSELINHGVLVDKIFTIEYDFDEFQNKPKARDDMFSAINEGKLMWFYVGHGSYDKLGSEDYLNGAVDMNKFNNAGKLPLFIAASCDVGQFDSYAFDCLGEKSVMLDNKGAISSITGTRETFAYDNIELFSRFFGYSVNLRNPSGYSLVMAKIAYTGNNTNDEKYAILGDPLLPVIPPQRDSTITFVTNGIDSILNSREQITLDGTFSAQGLNQSASIQAFNCDIVKAMENNSTYTLRGGNLFKGTASVVDSRFHSSFIVPDDVNNGNTGLVLAYLWDAETQKDYINYLFPLSMSDEAVPTDNTDAPQITMTLDSSSAASGSYVDANPVLTAVISDLNGINTTDSPGHSILLILDHNSQPVNVTDLFSYDEDSFTTGSLTYPLSGLSEGEHILQLIAFDNFNRPAVSSMEFNVIKTGKFAITDFLPYPNPMKKAGWFTFVLNESAELQLSLYTIRGKKIQTIKTTASSGYNQIYWDGRDADGDFPANNTYFVKMKATSLSGKHKAESTTKLVIYH